jgi:hypothetical protein
MKRFWSGEMIVKFLFTSILLGVISGLFTGINITSAVTEIQDTSFQITPLKKGSFYEDKTIGVIFPAKLGDMDLEWITQYPQPGLGYSLRYFYTLPRWIKVDVYVYNKKLSSIPFGIFSKAVNAEFLAVGRDIERQSSYHGVKKIAVGVFPKSKPILFLWTCYEFTILPQPGEMHPGPRISERYITGFGNHFIKVFAT